MLPHPPGSGAPAANPAATVRVIPAAGHMVPRDNRPDFMAALRSLLLEEFDVTPAAAAAG